MQIRRAANPEYAEVYDLVRRWRDRSLITGASLFAAQSMVWTVAAADELHRRFIDGADEGSRSFAEKLEDQMRGADQEATLLMAELMFVHLLPLTSVTLETKVRNIDMVGSWAPEPFTTPPELAAPFAKGIFNGGAGFNTQRPNHISFLIRFTQRWAALDPEQRRHLASSAWDFKDFVWELPLEKAMSQRNALLLMLFPDEFEDISAREHKKRIVAAFPALIGDTEDIDRQLLAIRQAKTDEFGQDFSWYDEDVRKLWDKKAPPKPRVEEASSPTEALERLFDAKTQTAVATALADAIEAAHAVNPRSWSVGFRDSGVSLNVGPNRMFRINPSEFFAAIIGTGVEALRSEFGDRLVVTNEPYSFPGDVFRVRSDVERTGELLGLITQRLVEASTRTAPRDTPYWKGHSPAALDMIRDMSGRELPDPGPRTDSAKSGQRAWIVRVKRDDGNVDSAGSLEQGDTRIFWSLDVAPGSSVEVIKAAFRAEDPDISAYLLGNMAGNVHRFISRAQPGDVVLMPDGSDLYFGTVTSDAEYLRDVGEWRRTVDWNDEPVDRGEVSPALYSRLRSLLTVTEITELLPEVNGYLLGGEVTEVIAAAPVANVQLAPIDDDLAKDWMLDREPLSEIAHLLGRKQQIIFYGPPGTGKTYLAQKLAEHFTADGGSYKLVQFHPSYSYEDFVEGFRPQVGVDGTLTYELTPGPLRLLAEAARENPGEPYLLIIDEINRGNLAKIFGELYYLLEYREQSLVLQYGSADEDEFSLPENLYVIGTMNTADRSIAMVDAAIRRRFNFFEFTPSKPPISGLLRTWLASKQLDDEPALLLDELNRRLDDEDYAIGPSYLMNDDVKTQAGLERIWKYSIMPLLFEHFYGQRGATDRFELAALQAAIRPEPAAAVVPDISAETDDAGS